MQVAAEKEVHLVATAELAAKLDDAQHVSQELAAAREAAEQQQQLAQQAQQLLKRQLQEAMRGKAIIEQQLVSLQDETSEASMLLQQYSDQLNAQQQANALQKEEMVTLGEHFQKRQAEFKVLEADKRAVEQELVAERDSNEGSLVELEELERSVWQMALQMKQLITVLVQIM